jgi:ABC-type uncharacterized transport system substrate-binding protein
MIEVMVITRSSGHGAADAGYVHKILQGTKPADLPVEQPVKFDLVVKLKTAKALGLQSPNPFCCAPTW